MKTFKDEQVDFDPNNMWHIEAFITSLRFHNKVHENDDADGNKRRIAFEVVIMSHVLLIFNFNFSAHLKAECVMNGRGLMPTLVGFLK